MVLIIGCSDIGYVASKTSDKIYSELKANKFESLKLSNYGGNGCTKVCFIGPYNEMSEKTLGFNWWVSGYMDVLKSDDDNMVSALIVRTQSL